MQHFFHSLPYLSDKWGTHSSALFNVELALGQGHTLRGSTEKLGARSMNHPKMREITGWKLQYTEVVRQGGGRATKWDGAVAAEHPEREITRVTARQPGRPQGTLGQRRRAMRCNRETLREILDC